ncbi:MAG: PQQ-binding-like beta-propeller repeat protein, partial [Phycisphaerae bacterium]|nr:PQQ-binding-like beta-propeller repeat protein [Phycisphaerae bacterium]
DSFTALHPCVADEVAYLPTGRGALIALDTTTWSIRWIVRYEQSLEISEERQRSGDAVLMVAPAARRPCSPLMATAGLLLAVPSDASYLYAFDRVDGRIVWRVEWGEHWYLLGADGGQCWLAGPTVTQVDLETGRPGWARAIGKPTGRGAISGDRLYLPTEDGLVVLNATTGDVIETRPVPASGRPLGNLLCWGTALYSCDIREVRAWPDMTRAYEQAVAAHAHSPAEATVALRLASLELLRDEHARALQVLEGARVTDDRRAEHVAHMQVEALLALARRPGVAADEANARLDEARRLARRPADQVRTGLALAEHSARLGRPDVAYRQYVEIALAQPNGEEIAMPPGEVMLDVGVGLRQRAGVAIGSRLARLERDLDASQREAVAGWLRERLDAAIALGAAAGFAPVRALTELGVLDEIRRRAGLQLGVWAQQDDRLEEAQACFEAVLRDGGADPPVAEALARLAMVSLSPDELHMPLQAEACIERLRAEFASAMLPGSLIGATEAQVSGLAVAEALQGRIDPETLSRHDRAVRNLRLGPPGELAYVVAPLDADLLQIRTPRTEPVAETLLWLKDWTEVRADLAHDGTLLWRATLRLLDEPAPVPVPGRIPSAVFPLGMGRPPLGQTALLPQPHATSDGQIMVVASPQGLHAIGLATGLRLWSRPYTQTTYAATASDRFVWAERGRLVSLDGYGRLALAGIADGDRVRWERGISAGSWAAVRLGDEYVVAVSEALDAVSVFHADDGRSLGEARFWQPTSEASRRLSLAVFDDLVCGPVSAAEVAAFELGAPGIERWRVRCERGGEPLAITGIFKPAPDQLAIGCERGLVKLVDPATGELLREIRLELPRARIFDGAISDDVLCLYAADGEQRDSFLVVAMDLSSGRMLWRYESQAGEYWSQGQYDYPLDNSLLRAARNAIPVVRLIGNQTARQRVPGVPLRQQGVREIELTILDKRTGRIIGRPQTLAFGEGETITRIDQVLVWPDRVIVVTDNACLAFAVEPPSEEGP